MRTFSFTALSLLVIFLLTPFFAASFSFVNIAHAQGEEINADGNNGPRTETDSQNQKIGLDNPLKTKSVECLIDFIITVALKIAAIIAVLALIWVGFKFVAAQGNPSKIQEAQAMLLAIVIGIVIIFGSKVIIDIVRGTISPIVGDKVIPNVQCNE